MRLCKPINNENELIFRPRDTDVLCGKNKVCMDHPGSKSFRLVIEQNAQRYLNADSKYEKMNITKEIYDELSQESRRFLKYNSKLKGWQELSSSQVRDKVGHSLRFRNKQRCSGASTTPASSYTSMSKKAIRRRIDSPDAESMTHMHMRKVSDGSSISASSLVSEEMPVYTGSTCNGLTVDPSSKLQTSNLELDPPQVTPPTSKTMRLLDAAQANLEQQLPLPKLEPSFSISAPRGLSPKSVSVWNDEGLMPTALASLPELDEVAGSSEPLTLANDRDVIDIMQEPLMEFEPQPVGPVQY